MERALAFTGQWLKIEEPGSVVFKVKPDISLGDGKDLDMLDAGRERGDLSRVAWINEMKRREILPEEFDEAADKQLIDAEPPKDDQSVSMSLKTGRASKSSKASRGGNPSDKRGPDKTATGDKQPIAERAPT